MTKYEDTYRLARKYKCPICKHNFYMSCEPNVWGYRIKSGGYAYVPVCSYKCMRIYEKPILEKQKKRMQKEFQKAWDDEVKIWDAMSM